MTVIPPAYDVTWMFTMVPNLLKCSLSLVMVLSSGGILRTSSLVFTWKFLLGKLPLLLKFGLKTRERYTMMQQILPSSSFNVCTVERVCEFMIAIQVLKMKARFTIKSLDKILWKSCTVQRQKSLQLYSLSTLTQIDFATLQLSWNLKKNKRWTFCTKPFNSYFCIHGFLAVGPSANIQPIGLFLLCCSELKQDMLLPGALAGVAGSVWITILAAEVAKRNVISIFSIWHFLLWRMNDSEHWECDYSVPLKPCPSLDVSPMRLGRCVCIRGMNWRYWLRPAPVSPGDSGL